MKQFEIVFKIRALHSTPLEFRTGFFAGGVKFESSDCYSYSDRGDTSISQISVTFQLLILMPMDKVMD